MLGNNFSISNSSKQDIPVIKVTGEIDIYTCPQLNNVLNETTQAGHSTIILNLEDVQYIDSTGLGSIAHAARNLSKADGEILIVSTRSQVKKVFEISGLNKKNVSLHDTEDQAIANKGA